MILTGQEIQKQIKLNHIIISPFQSKNLGPNSYDVTLSDSLLVYDLKQNEPLDMQKENQTQAMNIPKEGLILEPNQLYLGSTVETATSTKFVPMFEGRSSIGRLGINTHITAGFGDVGWGFNDKKECYFPTWTLEIAVVHPIRIYPNVRIGQVYFITPQGDISLYSGKYTKQKKPQASQLYKDFE